MQILLASWSFPNSLLESCRRPVDAVADGENNLRDRNDRDLVKGVRDVEEMQNEVEGVAENDGDRRFTQNLMAAVAELRGWRVGSLGALCWIFLGQTDAVVVGFK